MSDLPGYFLLLSYCMYFNGSCFNDVLFQCSTGCEFNDGCLAADKNYFDKENCVYYSCIAKNTTDGSITTQLKERWGEHRPRPCGLILVPGKFTQCKCPRFLSMMQAVLTTTNATSPPGRRLRTAPPTAAAERRAPSPSSTPVP